jgi:hypothetical protein
MCITWLGTDIIIKSERLKLVLWSHTSLLIKEGRLPQPSIIY